MAVSRVLRTVGARRIPRWVIYLVSAKVAVGILLAALVGVAMLGIFGGGGAHFSSRSAQQCPGSGTPGSPVVVPITGTLPTLTAEQQHNAQVIAGVALGLGLGRQGVLVGIVAALTESTLINVGHGDILGPDSIGLFQERAPWGPLSVRTDPAGAAGLFYKGGMGGQRGLMGVPGWQTMPPQMAAQSVEQSEFSDGSNYLGNLPAAMAITSALLAGQPSPPVGGPPVPVIVPLAPAQVGSCPPGSGLTPGAVYTPPGLTRTTSQDPASFGWVHAGPMEPLVWQGHDFGQVALGTVKLWTAMLNELVPLIPGGLDSDLGCFEDRPNVNNPSVLSFHAYGIACDLNSGVNSNGTNPQALQGRQFALPMATSAIAAKWGFEWGGDWISSTPDPMHIELAITPQQVAAWSATQP